MTFGEFALARLDALRTEERVPGGGISAYPGMNHVGGLIDLVLYAKPRSVLEIGSHRGVSTEVFLLHCSRVVAVDSWEGITEPPGWGRFYDEFLYRVGAYPSLHVVRGRSPQALEQFEDHEFDLVYIDGEHDEASVRADINGARRLVKPGGWLAGHDYVPNSDVERVVTAEAPGEIKLFADTSWLTKL